MSKCIAVIFYACKYGRNSRKEARLFTMFRRGTNKKDKILKNEGFKNLYYSPVTAE